MINLPYNATSMSQIMPCQNVPAQTSQNNFQSFQQPQTVTQQMQTSPCTVCPGNPQDPYKQAPFYQLYQPDIFTTTHQHLSNVLPTRNPCQPIFQTPYNVPPTAQTHNQPNYGSLPQNILEQIRATVSNASPIFILPGTCHQSTNHQQASTLPPPGQGGVSQSLGQPATFNYPPSIYCPPSFYPYPIPLPIYEPFGGQTRARGRTRSCECCQKRQESFEFKNHPLNCCYGFEQEEHHCTATNDDTICSKRNCPSSVSLQALASQFLSLPGIIPCAATRLILRKIPGSNITTTMEDTMDKAQRSIGVLTKEQLLTESRNAQQVNALINLHMTSNPPANIIPTLTLLQLKVNLLKAQVESLINKKLMESQGYAVEVETTGTIDPTVLALKTNAELRDFLTALRQKECDERINVNFAPYHSQRVIAETRLSNIQTKIRQVEAEFDRRRCTSIPPPSLTSRIVQQFSESYCTFGYGHSKFLENSPDRENSLDSPNPFSIKPRNPRRLYLKPHVGSPETSYESSKATNTTENVPSICNKKDSASDVRCTKERAAERRSSTEEDCTCCGETTSEESLEEAKKKLRLKIDRTGNVTITSLARLRDVSLMKLAPNVAAVIDARRVIAEKDEGGAKAVQIERSAVGIEISAAKESTEIEEVLKDDTSEAKKENGDKSENLKLEKREEDRARRESAEEKILEKRKDIQVVVSESREFEGEEDDSDGSSEESLIPIMLETTEQDSVGNVQPIDSPVDPHHVHFTIKEETESDSEDWKQSPFEPMKDVKMEPESVESMQPINEKGSSLKTEDSSNAQFTVKKESESDTNNSGKSQFKSTKEMKIEPANKCDVDNLEGSQFETTKHIKIEPESSKNTLSSKGSTTSNPTEESCSETPESEEEATAELKQKSSTSLYRASFQLALKPTKKRGINKKDVINENESRATNEINTEDEEWVREKKEEKNEQIVSMMTNIKYHRPFGVYGGWMEMGENASKKTEDRWKRDAADDSLRGTIGESMLQQNYACRGALSKKMDLSTESANRRYELKSRMINTFHDRYDKLEVNVSSKKMSKTKSTVRKDEELDLKNVREESDTEKITKGVKCLPVRRVNATQSTYTKAASGIAGNLFHREEIESCSRKTICNRSTSYHCDMKTENSIVSVIHSVIGNRLPSFSSLVDYIPTLRNILPNLRSSALSNNDSENTIPRVLPRKVNKNAKLDGRLASREIKDRDRVDWARSNTNIHNDQGKIFNKSSRLSVGEECTKLQELRHSIIVDKENKNYKLIGGSVSNQRRELARNDLKQPYQVRRSLIIRSRPKNGEDCNSEYLCPFTVLKRSKKSGILKSQETKISSNDEKYRLKSSEKFSSLPVAMEEDKDEVKTSKTVIAGNWNNDNSNNV